MNIIQVERALATGERRTLHALATSTELLNTTRLSVVIRRHPGTAGMWVNRLIKRGLVYRRPDNLLIVTQKGIEVLEIEWKRARETAAMWANLSREAHDRFISARGTYGQYRVG